MSDDENVVDLLFLVFLGCVWVMSIPWEIRRFLWGVTR